MRRIIYPIIMLLILLGYTPWIGSAGPSQNPYIYSGVMSYKTIVGVIPGVGAETVIESTVVRVEYWPERAMIHVGASITDRSLKGALGVVLKAAFNGGILESRESGMEVIYVESGTSNLYICRNLLESVIRLAGGGFIRVYHLKDNRIPVAIKTGISGDPGFITVGGVPLRLSLILQVAPGKVCGEPLIDGRKHAFITISVIAVILGSLYALTIWRKRIMPIQVYYNL